MGLTRRSSATSWPRGSTTDEGGRRLTVSEAVSRDSYLEQGLSAQGGSDSSSRRPAMRRKMITNLEELHREVEKLFPVQRRSCTLRALLHALIDLRKITTFKCQYERCIYPSRDFEVSSRYCAKRLSIDHINGLGGGERTDNLAIVHHGCNSSKGYRRRGRRG